MGQLLPANLQFSYRKLKLALTFTKSVPRPIQSISQNVGGCVGAIDREPKPHEDFWSKSVVPERITVLYFKVLANLGKLSLEDMKNTFQILNKALVGIFVMYICIYIF